LNAQTARAWDDPSLRAECRRGEGGGNGDCAANDATANLTNDPTNDPTSDATHD
jgi:hypothetical protein